MKRKSPEEFELRVVDRESGRTAFRHASQQSQLALSWRGDSRALAWLEAEGGNRRFQLVLWELVPEKPSVKLATPVTTSAALPLVWMGSSRLAYLVSGRENSIAVVDLEAGARVQTALTGVTSSCSFAASSDGRRIAAASQSEPGVAIVVDLVTHEQTRLPIAEGGELLSLDFAPDGNRLLSSARRRGSEDHDLLELDLTSREARSLVHGAGDIVDAFYVARGRRLAFFVAKDGERIFHLADADGSHVARLEGLVHGTGFARGFTAESRGFVYHEGLQSPPALYEIDTAASQARLVHGMAPALALPVPARRIDLIASDKRPIPAYLWSVGEQKQPAVVIWVHGGPKQHARRTWERGVFLALRRGVQFLAVNYRGSDGYGATFESLGDQHDEGSRVHDVISAVDYAHQTLGLAPKQITILASSYGTRVATRVAQRIPDRIGKLVLVSFVGVEPATPIPVPTWIIQGSNDLQFSPDRVRPIASVLFKSLKFEALPNEGHFFQRPSAWARVYEAVFEGPG